MKKLTIGSAVYDDFEGVYFTYQSLRLNNMDIWDDLDFVIIDNNPESAEGQATRQFCEGTQNIRYIPYTDRRSTSVRNEIFTNSEAEFCMSIDPHVLFEPDTIKRLISFFEDNPQSNDLYHGPMFYDVIKGHDPCSKMDPVWRDNMFGTWATDKRGNDKDNDPFEIEMHGLGIFACRTKAWLGFNEKFVGFGGEEGYIHKKFVAAGHKIWCLPFLRWVHRFQRPLGVKYPLLLEERIKNYLLGHEELGLPFDDIISHFKENHPDINIKDLIHTLHDESVVGDAPSTPSPTAPTNWETSSIKFNELLTFSFLKIECYSDTALRSINASGYTGEDPIIFSQSDEGLENTSSLFNVGPHFCQISASSSPKELVLQFPTEITPPLISIQHSPQCNLMAYISSDGNTWALISEINR